MSLLLALVLREAGWRQSQLHWKLYPGSDTANLMHRSEFQSNKVGKGLVLLLALGQLTLLSDQLSFVRGGGGEVVSL